LDKVHSAYFLAVHIETKELIPFLKSHADNVTFYVSEGYNTFLSIYSQRRYLIIMVVEVILVVDNTPDISECFDGAVPRS
jgi:hypothetical protein